jgi:hypothetical protein
LRRAILLCALCATPCLAADPLDRVLACRNLTDAAARLACFDRETAALARPAATPVAAAPEAPVATVPLTPEQKFGLSDSAIAAKEAAASPQAAKEAKLQARITGLALVGDGRTLFTLDNAQVWRQLEADGTDVFAKLGDVATISRGMFGSYYLALKSGRGCKVTRLR